MKVNRYIYFWVDIRVATPVDELKGHCAGYAKKEEMNKTGIVMNRYNMWTCRTVETLTGRS